MCDHGYVSIIACHRKENELWDTINPLYHKLYNYFFHPLKVMCRYRDPQLQVGGKYSYLFIT